MTQQCKYDEQLLDYVYGELSETEARRFAEHLHGCSACAAQVASFGRVRTEFKNRPPVEPAGESLQRMTALLMQAATESAAAQSPAAATGGGGKMLQFRSRGVRRLLRSPAGGVMAVAAAALFWVVFRSQPGPQSAGISSPTTFTTLEEAARAPAESAPTPAAPAAVVPVEKNAAEPTAGATAPATATVGGEAPKLEQRSDTGLVATGKDGKGGGSAKDEAEDFGGLRARSRPAKEPAALDQPVPQEGKPQAAPSDKRREVAQLGPPAAKPTTGSTPDTAASAASKTPPRAGDQLNYRSTAPAILALADKAYGKKKSANFEADQAPARPEEQFAQPPPPPQAAPAQAAPATPPAREPAQDDEDSVRGAIARTQEQRQQKVVEALANQELGSLGAGAGAPPTPPTDGRYAQRPASAAPSKADAPGNGLNHPLAASESAAPAATVPGGANLTRGGGNRDDSAATLTAVKEQLRRGQCAEANTALTKLERTSPGLPGLADTRAEWQSSCANPLLERRLANEAPEPAASPALRASKHQYGSPAPAKSPARKAAKPEPKNSKAADTLR